MYALCLPLVIHIQDGESYHVYVYLLATPLENVGVERAGVVLCLVRMHDQRHNILEGFATVVGTHSTGCLTDNESNQTTNDDDDDGDDFYYIARG